MLEQEPKVLSHAEWDENGLTKYEDYLSGWHKDLGILTMGMTGEETIHRGEGIKPVATVEVFESKKQVIKRVVEEMWYEKWDYPIQWSMEAAKTGSVLAPEHKKRLAAFQAEILEKLK